MRESTSGTTLPKCQYLWKIADQGIAANGGFTPAHIKCAGARANNGIPIAAARAQLPIQTAKTARPNLSVFVDADDFVTLTISNQSDAIALAATGADIVIDIMVFPLTP
jgi:hypothetical protein